MTWNQNAIEAIAHLEDEQVVEAAGRCDHNLRVYIDSQSKHAKNYLLST